jgi:hypothetical protein
MSIYVISSGYLIPFNKTPTSVNIRNNGSAFKHSSFVEQAINKLLESGAGTYMKRVTKHQISAINSC